MLRNQTRSAPTGRYGCRGLQEWRWGRRGGEQEGKGGARRGKRRQASFKQQSFPGAKLQWGHLLNN